MFSVVRTGGKQYRVTAGDKIVVEKLAGNAGDKVDITDILLAGEGSDLKPVAGMTVAAEIVAQAKGEKVTVFKKRRRHNYRRKKGHRQQHTILRIIAIGDHKHVPSKAEGAGKKAAAPKAETAPAEASAKAPAAPAKAKKAEAPAAVDTKPTENPAPQEESKANPPVKGDVEQAPEKAAGGKKATTGGKAAKAASTENAAPAKGGAKKAPKK